MPDRRRQRERQGACRRQGRSRHHPRRSRRAEECAGGGDAAQERRGALGAAGRERQGQEVRPEDHQDSASSPDTASASIGRTQANVNLLKVILKQYARRSGQGRDRSVPSHRGRRRRPQPEGRRLSGRRTGQQQDHRGCHRRIDARRRYADLPRDRFRRGDRAEPPDVRGVRNSRRRLRRLARPGRRTRSRRSASRTISWRAKALSESTVAAFTRQLFAIRQR